MLAVRQVKNESRCGKLRLFWLKNSGLISIIRSEKYTFCALPREWGENGVQALIFPQANRRCALFRSWNQTAEYSGRIPHRLERSGHSCNLTLDFRFSIEEI